MPGRCGRRHRLHRQDRDRKRVRVSPRDPRPRDGAHALLLWPRERQADGCLRRALGLVRWSDPPRDRRHRDHARAAGDDDRRPRRFGGAGQAVAAGCRLAGASLRAAQQERGPGPVRRDVRARDRQSSRPAGRLGRHAGGHGDHAQPLSRRGGGPGRRGDPGERRRDPHHQAARRARDRGCCPGDGGRGDGRGAQRRGRPGRRRGRGAGRRLAGAGRAGRAR